MVKIKICGVTSVDDMLAAAEAGADAIGLVFAPRSPRCVSIDQASAILKACPPFLSKVGLFVDPTQEEITNFIDCLPLDLLQFHGQEPAHLCASFKKPYLKALKMKPDEDIASQMASYRSAAGLLLDAYHPEFDGGTGEVFDWSLIPERIDLPLVLAGGLHAENVVSAMETVNPYAVDVSSGVESAPGVKDHAKIKAFCDAVRSACA